jgi:hypothetical protein
MAALGSVMAVALIGYFSTMVAAFAGLMLLLSSVLTSPYMNKPRPYPRLAVEIEQPAATAPANSAPDVQAQAGPTNAEGPDAVSVGQATTEKSKHLKVARGQTRRDVVQKDDPGRNGLVRNDLARKNNLARKNDLVRKEDTAGRHQDQEYSMSLGYAHEAQQQGSAPLFDFVQPRHF